MLRREKIHDAARGKFDGRRDGELYLPLRSSFAVVPIGGASNARLHPRLKSRPSCGVEDERSWKDAENTLCRKDPWREMPGR